MLKACYQCDKRVPYLFDDGRCKDCTRLTPEEVRGERTTERDTEVSVDISPELAMKMFACLKALLKIVDDAGIELEEVGRVQEVLDEAEGRRHFVVILEDFDGNTNYFPCYAGNAEHAKIQAAKEYPEDKVLCVNKGHNYTIEGVI